MVSRFRFARLLWFVLLIYAFLTLDSRYAEAEEGLASWYGPGLEGNPMASGAPYDPNGYTAASRTLPLGTSIAPQEMAQPPNFAQGGAQQPQLPQRSVQQPSSAQGAMQDVAGGGDYLVHPGDTLTDIASRLGTSVDNLAKSNGIADPDVIRSGQALHLPQSHSIAPTFMSDGIAPAFIRGQEGFRLDGYVPDPQSSRSGVTVGTGVDIGQMSVPEIGALDIPQDLKQKLAPYAGLIGLNAVNFLNSHPLHLTQDEANALDRVVAQNTIGGVAHRFNMEATGNSFADLPPAAQTVITDLAYQYGVNFSQRMPDFWSEVTAGRWDSVVQKLRNFGDRYPTRRNAEADLLQGAIQRGDFSSYVVQPGETLPEIASRLETSVDHLVRSNGIVDPNTIYSGQALYY